MYHPLKNGQVERFNCTIIAMLRDYGEQSHMKRDVHTDILTYGYNTQIRRIANCTLFKLVLSQMPHAIVMQPNREGVPSESPRAYLHRWELGLSRLARDADDHMLKCQKK